MFTHTQILNPCHFFAHPAVLQVEKISMNLRHLTARPGQSQRLVRTWRRVGSKVVDLPPRSLGIICLWKKTWWPTILTFGDGMGWHRCFLPPLPVQFSHRYQLVVKTLVPCSPSKKPGIYGCSSHQIVAPALTVPGSSAAASCDRKDVPAETADQKNIKKSSTENTGYPLK